MLLNQQREAQESMRDPKDFSNVMKVDTHIHLSAAMTSVCQYYGLLLLA